LVILTKLKRSDFEKILENYRIGKYKSHEHISYALDNTVYVVKTTKGRYLIKIFEDSTKEFIKFQLKIMDLLEKNKLPSPEMIKTAENEAINFFGKKPFIVQKFVDGKRPKRYSDVLLKNIARNQGLMNKTLTKLKKRKKPTWGKDYQFKLLKTKIGTYAGFDTDNENLKLIKEMKTLNRKKLRKEQFMVIFWRLTYWLKMIRLQQYLIGTMHERIS